MKNYIDHNGNELNLTGKWIAGILLMLLTSFSVLLLIAYWPDRIPLSTDKGQSYYKMELFHVRLFNVPDSCLNKSNSFCAQVKADSIKKTVDTTEKDSIGVDTSGIAIKTGTKHEVVSSKPNLDELIHLNTLLLLLVAIAGFLGNMIHVSTSFTTFVGAGKFKNSWLLWYFVKPFVASALAIAMYFVLCGGFLTVNNNPNNINIYGVLTISILTGLFTDRTTLKLKEVFEVLLKPKEDRANPLTGDLKILAISSEVIEIGKENTLILTGENMQKEKFKVLIDDKEITAVISSTSTMIRYTLPEEFKDKTSLILIVKNEKNTELFKRTLTIKKS